MKLSPPIWAQLLPALVAGALLAGSFQGICGDQPADPPAQVTIVFDNGNLTLGYLPANLGELFTREGIDAAPEDFGHSSDEPVAPGHPIRLAGITFVEAKAEYDIPPRIVFQYEFSPGLDGVELTSQGEPGRERVTLRRYYAGGAIVGENRKSDIIKDPAKTFVTVYTSVNASFSPSFYELLHKPILSTELPPPAYYKRKIAMEATAYYPGVDSNGRFGNLTAMGYQAMPGRVAVDPSVIRLGSVLFVEGYGYCVAVDTGGAIKGARIDLCYNTRQECNEFGRRQLTVYVLE